VSRSALVDILEDPDQAGLGRAFLKGHSDRQASRDSLRTPVIEDV
jgi:hypothetical protein